ncbi:hypothetical protein RchiOBHm_Chr7g0209831 [Rosa chinensis]|uniref:Uncharacterized protein n=1 Tax=Rosa chinensis TaxID=74649 RepID=A0A2P6PA28_ROSCH|nr:hypothetical protein RchiOBHm_Chr7g0209831 [Rosa chinensis]
MCLLLGSSNRGFNKMPVITSDTEAVYFMWLEPFEMGWWIRVYLLFKLPFSATLFIV